MGLAGALTVKEAPLTYTKSTPVLLAYFWYSSYSSSLPPSMKPLLGLFLSSLA